MTDEFEPVHVAVIGAGIGGITAAIALQTQLNFYDYTIYEMAGGVGGTWLANTYPGCVCDVPSHWYSLSTEPNPDWSMMFSGQAEIKAYWEGLVHKHQIEPRIELLTEVLSAVWDEATQQYIITVRDIDALYISWKDGPWATYMRRQREQASIQAVKDLVPEKHYQNMIPKYPMGCRPNIIGHGYLASLQRPNIQLEWDPIAEITDSGVVTKSGKSYDLDVICYATGFDIEGSLSMEVTGINGQTMRNYYNEEGGPTAYMGTTTPGIPNWFTLLGPNAVTEHASIIYVEEVQVNHSYLAR
ncbi:hypothetical protein FRC08_002183 [Ceratobasidium sp. 394]|nr:hypothetical protein FRC08_002183 [Ceratobasidium sp. 394]